MESARNLAKYIVVKCSKDGMPISNLQLQKVLYFLQLVYCRASNGKLLFLDEFEAWQYGPVLPRIYREYREYGADPICRSNDSLPVLDFEPFVLGFIDQGIDSLRRKSPWDLVRISHAKESPWAAIWQNGRGYRNSIPNQLIINFAVEGKLYA